MYIFALFRRISFKLGKLLYFKAVFPAVPMDDGCSLIALYKKLKKKWKGLKKKKKKKSSPMHLDNSRSIRYKPDFIYVNIKWFTIGCCFYGK